LDLNIQLFRNFLWLNYFNAFLARKLTFDDAYCILSHPKLFGKKFNEVSVSFSVDRRRGNTDF